MAHRLSWLFPPVGIVLFAILVQGRGLFHDEFPFDLLAGLAVFLYLIAFGIKLAKDAVTRRE